MISGKHEAASPICVHYDHNMAGESVTNPRQRVPPLQINHLFKAFKAYMEVHHGDTIDDLHDCDEFILYDGGKPLLGKEMQKVFSKAQEKEVKPVTIIYSRNDLQNRRERTSTGAVNQVETQLRITKTTPVRPIKQGPNGGAYNDGNAVGPIRLPTWGAKNVLMATRSVKKLMFGKFRVTVGGRGGVEDTDETPAAKRVRLAANLDEQEPAFLHSAEVGFYEDELVMGNFSGVVDFTPGQGYYLWAAVQQNVQAIAFAMTEAHKHALDMHLLSLTLQAMATEGHAFYEPRMASVLAEHGETAAPTVPGSTKPPGRPRGATTKGKAKAKAKGKGKAKARARTAENQAGDSESSEDPQEEPEEEGAEGEMRQRQS